MSERYPTDVQMQETAPPAELNFDALFAGLKELRTHGLRPAIRDGRVPALVALAFKVASAQNPALADQIKAGTADERHGAATEQLKAMLEAAAERLDGKRNEAVGDLLALASDGDPPKLKIRRLATAEKMHYSVHTLQRWKETPLLKDLATALLNLYGQERANEPKPDQATPAPKSSAQTHEGDDAPTEAETTRPDRVVAPPTRPSAQSRVRAAITRYRSALVAVTAACVLGGTAVGVRLLTFDHTQPPRSAQTISTAHFSTGSASLLTSAHVPEVSKGSGTQTMRARGYYGKRSFVARSGLVLYYRNTQDFEIVLFPKPVSCHWWYRGTPVGIELDIDVYANSADVAAIPIDEPLRQYDITWVLDRGNTTQLDYGAVHFDGIDEPGLVTLTSIETIPGGFWRGVVSTKHSDTASGVSQKFSGTFAAKWCDISPE